MGSMASLCTWPIMSNSARAASNSAGNVSQQELELAIKTAIELRREVLAWLERSYPALVKN
jgi:hypothetical protein